TCCPEQLASL
ncbi:hypothetical protein BN1723_020880, partial [Verticillium longisporum]